jgi:hypothetical protein
LAWPAIAHWCRRLVDTLAALILGKFVIVSVLSLAVGALAGGSGSTPAGSTGAGAGDHGSFSDVLGGAALLMLAAFAPWALFRLLPFLEAGAVSHLEGAGRRTLQAATGPPKSLAQTAMRFSAGGAAGGAGEVGMAMASAVGGESSEGGAGEGGGTAGSGSPLPDLGRSSVEKNRVGTATPPGASVHKRTPQPKAGHAFNAVMRGEAPSGEEDTSGSAGLPSGSQAAQPLTPKT